MTTYRIIKPAPAYQPTLAERVRHQPISDSEAEQLFEHQMVHEQRRIDRSPIAKRLAAWVESGEWLA